MRFDQVQGGCCEDGDAGAPLENKEKDFIKKYYDLVEPYMTKEGIKEVKQVGQFLYDREFGWVTPTLNGQICAYGFKENGIIKCAFEQAYNDGKIPWKKPISCHLFPIKVQKANRIPILNIWIMNLVKTYARRPVPWVLN